MCPRDVPAVIIRPNSDRLNCFWLVFFKLKRTPPLIPWVNFVPLTFLCTIIAIFLPLWNILRVAPNSKLDYVFIVHLLKFIYLTNRTGSLPDCIFMGLHIRSSLKKYNLGRWGIIDESRTHFEAVWLAQRHYPSSWANFSKLLLILNVNAKWKFSSFKYVSLFIHGAVPKFFWLMK